MLHESNENNKLTIEETDITFDTIYSKPYFPNEYEQEIKQANLLLIPYPSFRDFDKPVFPEETQRFLDFLKEQQNESLKPDIVISDDEYRELELHADLVTLPLLILDKVVVPLVVGLITSYIYEKKRVRKTELKLKVTMTVVDGEKSKTLSYEGDADQFENTVQAAKENFYD
ncbi:hypothetical protein [Domibacillus iocasae]|uniref:Uncharacterized protein n=1 Tax=Domibacillus iocasae TaxID=1714016 RepID=A0A1E7DQQ1_9BACI|nr:hypothetical protein [Domibacillus iocasae]OES45384.1 hypothetical protein BA724_05110 [Domibacillus iocasae]